MRPISGRVSSHDGRLKGSASSLKELEVCGQKKKKGAVSHLFVLLF